MKVWMSVVSFSTYLKHLIKYGIIFNLKQNDISDKLVLYFFEKWKAESST